MLGSFYYYLQPSEVCTSSELLHSFFKDLGFDVQCFTFHSFVLLNVPFPELCSLFGQ